MKRLFRARDFQPDARRDVREELQSHLELKAEDLMAQGMPEAEAWKEARRSFEEIERDGAQATSHTRARLRRRGIRDRFETLIQDLRYAVRRLTRAPGFTAAAILSLAIGIGANTAVFSVVNTLLLKPLPYRAPDELVRIYTSHPNLSPWGSSAYPDYLDMKAMDGVFSDVGVFYDLLAPVTLGEAPRMTMIEAISASFLPMLGVEPVLGRGFLPEEDLEPGQNNVALLGFGFWKRAFGGDPNVLGRTLRISGRPYTIVGVTPESFGSGMISSLKSDVFVPVTQASQIEGSRAGGSYGNRGYRTFNLEARLLPGVTVEEARARLQALAASLQESYAASNQNRSFRVLPAREVKTSPELDGGLPFVAAFLLAVVGMVLLLACTNLASFLLAQGIRRQREIAVRLALGAQRGRLVRQLLSETVILGLLGGGAGLFLAIWTLGLVQGLLPALPGGVTLEIALDWRVLTYTLLLSACAGILFGLAPAQQSTRPDITPTLKGSSSNPGKRRFRFLSALVGLQMAISVILLVGGGLFARALLVAENTDPGFSIQDGGVAWLDLAMSGIPREGWRNAEVDLVDRLLADPGIESVATASQIPLALGSSFQLFTLPGVEPPAGMEGHRIHYSQVGPSFFTTMEIPILVGRALSPEDVSGAADVAVVSEEMARSFWPGEDPIGKQILRGSAERAATVVGVARDTKVERLGEDPIPFIYFARDQYPTSQLRVVARGRGGSSNLVATLQRVIREVNPNFAVLEVRPMEDHLSLLLFPARVAALLLGAFGSLAPFLAAIGLYGAVNFSVSSRTREIGIRMSLGADRSSVIGSLMKGELRVVALGGLLGLVAAYALARVIQVFLYGIGAGDPLTFTLVPALLGAVAAVAAFVPAQRATGVNPTEALRTE